MTTEDSEEEVTPEVITKNPYLDKIQKKIRLVIYKLYKTLRDDDTITFEELTRSWGYNHAGCVWIDIGRLRTWQFKDEVKKAYKWEAEQERKNAMDLAAKKDDEFAKTIELQNKLNHISCIYVRWDALLSYYNFEKAEKKLIKKLQKLDCVYYRKPAYTNCFCKIEAPNAAILGDSKYGDILVPLDYIDLDKTFQSHYSVDS